jgi:hypothetical protein
MLGLLPHAMLAPVGDSPDEPPEAERLADPRPDGKASRSAFAEPCFGPAKRANRKEGEMDILRSSATVRRWKWALLAPAALAALMVALLATPVMGSVFPPLGGVLRSSDTQAPTPPALINFQGRLTDSGGTPLTGTYSVAFRVFSVLTGGSALWTETQPTVAVASGLFNVQLGSVTTFPSDLFAGTPRYLEVTVGGDPALTPRQQFLTVPYALYAGAAGAAVSADTAGTTSLLGFSLTTADSGNVGHDTSITVGTDGLPVISYLDGGNGDLKVDHCGNASCSAGNTITTVDSAGLVGFYTSITVGMDGLPVISYYDGTNGDLKVAHCGNASCSAGNTLTTVDSGGDVGRYTSITVGGDGLPVISYYDVTNGDLKVAHCSTVTCNVNFLTTVVGGFDIGQYTSITVGTEGLPVISYYYVTGGDLVVTHCGNYLCSVANTTTFIDNTVGDVGQYTSITVGGDGLPASATTT